MDSLSSSHLVRHEDYLRSVRARSARILIISLSFQRQNTPTHMSLATVLQELLEHSSLNILTLNVITKRTKLALRARTQVKAVYKTQNRLRVDSAHGWCERHVVGERKSLVIDESPEKRHVPILLV